MKGKFFLPHRDVNQGCEPWSPRARTKFWLKPNLFGNQVCLLNFYRFGCFDTSGLFQEQPVKQLIENCRFFNICYVDKYFGRDCCIFQPAFGCCALQTLVKICFFNVFHAKRAENYEKWGKIKSPLLILLSGQHIIVLLWFEQLIEHNSEHSVWDLSKKTCSCLVF